MGHSNTTNKGHVPSRYPERRSNASSQGQREMAAGDAPTHEVTALSTRSGAKGTIGVGWLKQGQDGTYLSISLMPFVVLDGTAGDVIVNVFERDFKDRRAEKEAQLNLMRAPGEVRDEREKEGRDPDELNAMYRIYADVVKGRIMPPSEWFAAFTAFKNAQAPDHQWVYPGDFLNWCYGKTGGPEETRPVGTVPADDPELMGLYRKYMKWAVDMPGTLSFVDWMGAYIKWARYASGDGGPDPMDFRDWCLSVGPHKPKPPDAPRENAEGEPIPF